jgi:hypothetical protein
MAPVSTIAADISEVFDFDKLQKLLTNYEYEDWYSVEFFFLGHEFRLKKVHSVVILFQLIDRHEQANGLSQTVSESWTRLLAIECSELDKIEYRIKIPAGVIDKTIEYLKMNFVDEILRV